MFIGLTGTLAAGKGTAADYLVGKGFNYYSLSDELRILLRAEGVPPTRDNLREHGTAVREKHGPGFLAELIVRRLRSTSRNYDSVIDGIRNEAEVAALRELRNFHLVSVDGPVDLRYERSRKRNTRRDPKSFSEFLVQERKELHGKDTGLQIASCMEKADYKINNDKDHKNLYKQIEHILEQVKG
jgi:dephospho-CoA kinase